MRSGWQDDACADQSAPVTTIIPAAPVKRARNTAAPLLDDSATPPPTPAASPKRRRVTAAPAPMSLHETWAQMDASGVAAADVAVAPARKRAKAPRRAAESDGSRPLRVVRPTNPPEPFVDDADLRELSSRVRNDTGAYAAYGAYDDAALSEPMEVTGRRRVTRARRIQPQDVALVERATEMLQVLEPVPATVMQPMASADRAAMGRTAPTMRAVALAAPKDLAEQTTVHMPVLIAPKTRPTLAALVPVTPPRVVGQARAMRRSTTIWTLAILTIASVLFAVSPIGRHFLPQSAQPHGVLAAIDPGHNTSGGAFSSASGSTDILGIGGGAGPGVVAPGSAGLAVKTSAVQQAPAPAPVATGNGVLPPPVSPWPPADPYMYVPGHPAFAMTDVNNYYSWVFGQCTWWAQYRRQDENFSYIGNARYWADGAAARGYSVGNIPVAGSTVVFQPGVQGAGGAGHVAHVEEVYPGGWYLVSEMNFFWNGGGLGRVDYRYAHTGWGVSFIY